MANSRGQASLLKLSRLSTLNNFTYRGSVNWHKLVFRFGKLVTRLPVVKSTISRAAGFSKFSTWLDLVNSTTSRAVGSSELFTRLGVVNYSRGWLQSIQQFHTPLGLVNSTLTRRFCFERELELSPTTRGLTCMCAIQNQIEPFKSCQID